MTTDQLDLILRTSKNNLQIAETYLQHARDQLGRLQVALAELDPQTATDQDPPEKPHPNGAKTHGPD